MSEKLKRFLPVLVVAVVASAVLIWQPHPKPPPEEINRAKLEKLMSNNAVLEAELTPKPYKDIYAVKGLYRRGVTGPKVEFSITTHLTEGQVEALLAKPASQLALPKPSSRSQILEIAPTIVIALLVIGLLIYQNNLGKARNGSRLRQRPTTRFDDVAGIEEAKAEVQEVIDFLRHPAKYRKLGGNLPKGILLVGPPGTGKTLLARAIAGEANANFFTASGSDFTEVFVGVGAKRIRELFRQARASKPAIIFIDEIDCLKSRRQDQNGETQQTMNALLTCMDGFESTEGVIVVAATNRPEDLDEALLRPGRFDRKVFVPLPDTKGRRAILQTHVRNTPIHAPEHALAILAQTTAGMSGAELASVVNEAAILSAQKSIAQVGLAELEEARDKVRWGKERRSLVVKADERRVVAYHEAGHAMVQLHKPLLPQLHKVSIIPRGQALGTTTALPKEDQYIHSKGFLIEQLAVLMGGRASEGIFLGDITNGANGDLNSAKDIARKMIHDWGMGQRLYYEPTKDDTEREINSLLSEAMTEATNLITRHRAETQELAETLLREETLTRDEVLKLMQRVGEEKTQAQDCPEPVAF
jgi:cell division protease FtsH